MVDPYGFYTYAYLREDRTPYYIGKGSKGRIFSKKDRVVNLPKDKSRIIFLKKNLTEEEAFRHEIYMISVFGRKDLETGILHNRTDGGEGSSGHVVSEEVKEKLKEFNIGKKHSEESKKKISKASKRKFTKEVQEKLLESWRGKKHSEESKKKISEKNKGRTLSAESKNKISETHKGKPKSEEHKQKLRESNLGKKHSEESKKKMSESMKGNQNKKRKT
jgi:hypothetical protein